MRQASQQILALRRAVCQPHGRDAAELVSKRFSGVLECSCSGAASTSSTAVCAPWLFRGLSQSAAPGGRRAGGSGLKSLISDYKQLSKFKLSSLVVLTAGAGYIGGSGDSIDWAGLALTSLGTFGAAACANTLNQLYEVANDRLMSRTCNRPLPAGRLSRLHAAGFALAAGAAGLSILYTQTNTLTTILGASNIALYAGVYTPLKQISFLNTWVGAVVGAIPPLMGWASASGGHLDAGAWVLAAALFSWQMPHFMALAWMCKDDYMRGGFRMLSMFDSTGRRTAMVALRHCLALVPIGLLAYAADAATWPVALESAALAAFMGIYTVKFAAAPGPQSARKMFKASLLYLPLLVVGMAVHRLPRQEVSMEQMLARLGVMAEEAGAGEAVELAEQGYEALVNSITLVGASLGLVTNIKCPSKVHCDTGDDLEQQEGLAAGVKLLEVQEVGEEEEGEAEGQEGKQQSQQR